MEPINRSDSEPPESRRRPQGMPWWPAVVVIVVLILLLGWYLKSRSQEEELPLAPVAESGTVQPAEAPVEMAEKTAEAQLPTISESDAYLQKVAAGLSSHPEWLSWLATDSLVRRFVAGVDEVARGELPAAQAGYLGPKRGFEPASEAGQPYLGSASQDRYDRSIAVISGLDADGVARLYAQTRPLLRDAYRDLGYPQADFDAALREAIREILEAPVLDYDPKLEPGLKSYSYADPKLEALPPVHKLMIRLGPENALVVKNKLREILAALDRAQVAGGGSGR